MESPRDTEPPQDTVATSDSQDKPLSKSAQKKAAKAAYIATLKLERRAREKEKKKEKKRAFAEKIAAGEVDEGEVRGTKRAKIGNAKTEPFGARVVVDLGFDELMNEKVSY